MRGTVARALRKVASFEVHAPREYRTFTIPKKGMIYQFDPVLKETKLVERTVDKEIEECVTGCRKVYRYLKKTYSQFKNDPNLDNIELPFTSLPTKEELNKIEREYKDEQRKLSNSNTNNGDINDRNK